MSSTRLTKFIIIIGTLFGLIFIFTLFILNSSSITGTFDIFEGTFFVIGVILLRIIILALMAFYMFRVWFQAEQQFLSDIPFLFAFFFLILIFGKSLDLLANLIYYTSTVEVFQIILKIRYIIAIIDLLPLYHLSIAVILDNPKLVEKYNKFKSEKFQLKFKKVLLITIFLVQLAVIIFLLNENTGRIILPAIVIPSILMIIIIFIFCYRNKVLSQANSLILSIAFTAYLISQIIRPLMQTILGLTAFYIVLAEIIDLIVFMIIFLGLIIKPNYS